MADARDEPRLSEKPPAKTGRPAVRDLAILLVALLLPVGLFVGMYANRLLAHRAISGTVADRAQARDVPGLRRWMDRIPRGAQNIWYCARPLGGLFNAHFDLDESEFLRWMAEHDWRAEAIESPRACEFPLVMRDGSTFYLVVPDGYRFQQTATQGGDGARAQPEITIAYHRQARRVYYREVW